MVKEEANQNNNSEEKPPVGGAWKNLYFAVIGFLFFEIILFYIITNIFS